MLEVIKSKIRPLSLDVGLLEKAYQMYLEAPQASHPEIDLVALARQTGRSPLDCRNAIVDANRLGRFPDCALRSR